MDSLKVFFLACLLAPGALAQFAFTTPAGANAAGGTTVPENTAGTPVTIDTLVAATGTAPMTYTIVSQDGDTDSANFLFEISTADLKTISTATAATYDFETKSSYVLVLRAVDAAGTPLTATGTLTVSITDVNEAPMFAAAMAPACISSSSGTGTTVATWTATDPDTQANANNAVTGYNINGGDTSSQFAVSAAGIVTRTAVPLDATAKAQYFLTYEGDDGTLTGTTTVVIYLDQDSYCGGAVGIRGSLAAAVSLLVYLIYQIL